MPQRARSDWSLFALSPSRSQQGLHRGPNNCPMQAPTAVVTTIATAIATNTTSVSAIAIITTIATIATTASSFAPVRSAFHRWLHKHKGQVLQCGTGL